MDSIHGEGLFKRGLTVTAVCTSCHTAHFVLPHTDPRSSIAKQNIAKTCTHCHAQIEAVHRKVIRGELWEKQPHLIPACVDCHSPHKVRKVFYTQGMADRDCMRCHGDPTSKAARRRNGLALHRTRTSSAHSRHARVACVQCHTGGDAVRRHAALPHDRRPRSTARSATRRSSTSTARARTASSPRRAARTRPACRDCHGTHGILGKSDPPRRRSPATCPPSAPSATARGRRRPCATTGPSGRSSSTTSRASTARGCWRAASPSPPTAPTATAPTASCRPPIRAPRVNRANVARTCAKCHRGIYELFTESVHSPTVTRTAKKLPVCSDCHSAHSIQRTDLSNFRLHIMDQCGRCHEEITETLLRHLPRQGLEARLPEDGQVLRLPRLARHPAGDRSAVAPQPEQHRQDVRQVPHRLAPPVRRLPHARHAPRSRSAIRSSSTPSGA